MFVRVSYGDGTEDALDESDELLSGEFGLLGSRLSNQSPNVFLAVDRLVMEF